MTKMTDLKSIDIKSPTTDDLWKINAAVSEHILGEKIEWREWPGQINPHPLTISESGSEWEVRRYSTAEKWIPEIDKAMQEKGWRLEISEMADYGLSVKFYSARHRRSVGFRSRLYCKPFPVCIAALRALEVM